MNLICRIWSRYLEKIFLLIIFILTTGASNPVVSVVNKTILGPGDFNSNNAWFEIDPPELGWPLPEPRTATAQGNHAEVSLSASPLHAGNAQAQIYLTFDWDLGGYSWEDVKNKELELTVDFSYQIKAVYTPYGSSNAGVTIRGLPGNFDSYWYDYVGHQYGTTGGDIPINRVKKFKTTVLDLDNLGRVLYGHAVCQALLPDFGQTTQGLTNSSAATLTINSITVQPMPKNYGLFIGVNDNFLSGITDAKRMQYAFISLGVPSSNTRLITNEYWFISREKIEDNVLELNNKMANGDILWIYLSSHGNNNLESIDTPETTMTSGDEYLDLGPYITDDWLATLLKKMNPKISKWVIIDACKSGGFWGNFNLGDTGDLEKCPNTALLAASAEEVPEGKNAKSFSDYTGVMTFAILQALKPDVNGKVKIADSNGFFTLLDLYLEVKDNPELKKREQEIVYDREIGDPSIFTMDNFAPVALKTEDFVDGFWTTKKSTIPPGILMLLLSD